MKIKELLLERVTKWLVGGDLFDFIKQEVKTMFDVNLTGGEKRKKVFADAKKFAGNTADYFINLAIEVAVLLLKNK